MKTTSALSALALVVSATTAALLGTSATAAPATEARAGKWQVSAKISTDQVVAKEDTVKVTGRVTPKAAGQKLIVQQRVGNKKKWKKAGTTKVKANGKYVFKDKPNATGERDYRVIKPASNGRRKGVSKTVSTTVYGWEKLYGYGSTAQDGAVVTSGSVAAESMWPVVTLEEGRTDGFLEVTLGRKCLAMKTDWAMLDASVTGSTGSIALSADGNALVSHDLVIGELVEDTEFDLTDVYRIRFDVKATTGGYPAAIEPELLCM